MLCSRYGRQSQTMNRSQKQTILSASLLPRDEAEFLLQVAPSSAKVFGARIFRLLDERLALAEIQSVIMKAHFFFSANAGSISFVP
jgi:hypothetical protein